MSQSSRRELEGLVKYIYRPVWEWLISLLFIFHGLEFRQVTPQPNYKEGWEEWSFPEFPERGNGMINT